MKKFTISALALVMTLGLAGCSSDDDEMVDLDKAGDNISNMADDAGDAIEESYEDVTGQNDRALGKKPKTPREMLVKKSVRPQKRRATPWKMLWTTLPSKHRHRSKNRSHCSGFFVLHIRPDHALQKYPLQS